MIDDVFEIIQSYAGPLSLTPGGWYTRNCMMCHHYGHGRDTRNRLGITKEHDHIGANCFNCGFKVKFTPGHTFSRDLRLFLREIGVPEQDIERLNFESYKQMGLEERKSIATSRHLVSEWDRIHLPEEFQTLKVWEEFGCDEEDFINARDYIKSRGFDNLNDFLWCPTGAMSKRIVLPFYYNKKVVGYTARYIGTPPGKTPKYLNKIPTGFLYNIDRQIESRSSIIITEGVLDAYSVGGVSTLGNSINRAQIDFLNRMHKRIILVPDFDSSGEELLEIALAEEWDVSVPFWYTEVKDCADATVRYGRIATAKSIMDGIVRSPFEARIKWRMAINGRDKGL